jgi:nitrous oxidase accessory protein NosD
MRNRFLGLVPTALTHVGVTAALLGITCVAGSATPWSGTVRTVGKPGTACPNAQYTTITDAVNAAAPGDVIEICPALYPEQLTITIPLTLRGLGVDGINRVLIQPSSLVPVGSLPFEAVITVMNTQGLTIQNLAIDASNNTASGCTVALAGIHFYNASGVVDSNAISGTQLSNPLSCTTLFPGNGFGVQVDETAGSTTSFCVTVRNTSIHDFGRNGILVVGSGETAEIDGNSIAGVGPSTGVNQFGVFLADGATGHVTGNSISQGNCGTIPIPDCFNLRSEGVVLRSVGNGTVVADNMITNVQAGVFVNGATEAVVRGNIISNVDALDGIHIQGSTSGLFTKNRIFHVGPFTTDTSTDEEGCGVNDISGTGSSENNILANWINDAYCGVGYVSTDRVEANVFLNTLYETLNGDDYPISFPPPVEP